LRNKVYIQYIIIALATLGAGAAGVCLSTAWEASISGKGKEVVVNNMHVVAQVVLKRADGKSILDAKGPLTSDNIGAFSVENERIREARKRLEKLGFSISSQNQTTLSITGPAKRFTEVFGIEENMISGPSSDIHAVVIPPDLREFIADVFIPKPPEFF